MMRYLLPATGLFLTALLSPHAVAQLPAPIAPSGNFADVSFGLYWQGSDTPQPQEIHANSFTSPGSLDVLPTGGANFPTYRIAAITAGLRRLFPNIPQTTVFPPARLDGVSTGNDQIPMGYSAANDRFELLDVTQTNTQWGTIFFNVDNSGPVEPNSIFDMQSQFLGPTGIGTEVAGFYVPSNTVAANMSGQTFLEVSHAFLNGVPPGTGEKPQLAAIDLAMPHIVNWAGATPAPPEMEIFDWIAFSLPQDYVQELENLVGGPLTVTVGNTTRTLHGTSIITMQWTNNQWDNPAIVCDYTDFPGILDDKDDVDAVGMGDVPSGLPVAPNYALNNLVKPNSNGFVPDYFLMSPADANKSQLLVYSTNIYNGPTSKLAPLHVGPNPTDPPVIRSSGIRPGQNVKAVCSGDPEGSTNGKLWGHPAIDRPGTIAPGTPKFVVSAYCGQPSDGKTKTKTSPVYFMSAGKLPFDCAVVAYFGFPSAVPIPVPINTGIPDQSAFLGTWFANTPVFRSSVDLLVDWDVDVITYRATATWYERSNCVRIHTR